MKRILTMLLLSMIMLTVSGYLHAGEPGAAGRSVKIHDAGKTMVYVGGGTVLAGLTFSAITFAEDYYSSCDRGVSVGPYIGLVTAGIGGVVALAGIPVMLSGRAVIRDDGGLMTVFPSDDSKGWGTIVELGGGFPYLKAGAGVGYNFSDDFYLGASVAGNYDWFGFQAFDSIPVYADARFAFGSKRVSPYVGLNAGYDILNTGVYAAVNYGVRIRNASRTSTSWWIASNVEYVSGNERLYNVGVKIGYMF